MPAVNKDGALPARKAQISDVFVSDNAKCTRGNNSAKSIFLRTDKKVFTGDFKWRRSHLIAVSNDSEHIEKPRSRKTLSILGLIFVIGIVGRANAGYNEFEDIGIGSSITRVDRLWALEAAGGESNIDPMAGIALGGADPCGIELSKSCLSPTNAGNYIDQYWHYLVDRFQYYYLDQGQYNLLGGFSYVLGHPCYPKMFEREIDQAIGFKGRVYVFWFGVCSYLPLEGGYAQSFSGIGDNRWNVCMPWVGGGAIFPGIGLRFSQTAGDYIDRWQYRYKDLGQYLYLDNMQYDLLGGLAYMYGRFHYGPDYRDIAYIRRYGDIDMARDFCRVPEPCTAAFMVMSLLVVIKLRRRST